MSIPFIISLNIGKLIARFGGTALPGLIAQKLYPNLINQIAGQNRLTGIIITGTNGKTSTAHLLGKLLSANQIDYCHNSSGSNLLRGIATTLINQSDWRGRVKAKTAVWEVDEAVLPAAIKALRPKLVLLTNLSRDQMDRYGELDSLLRRWQSGLNFLPPSSTVFINRSDPKLMGLKHLRIRYFGNPVPGKGLTFPRGSSGQFIFDTIWAVTAIGRLLQLPTNVPRLARQTPPAFGRGELFRLDGKAYQINLIKNPASAKAIWAMLGRSGHINCPMLLALNDRLADGTDVSWIWDAPFTGAAKLKAKVVFSGTRAADMALRLKYAGLKTSQIAVIDDLKQAWSYFSRIHSRHKHILPTYTALLELRKILGRAAWN